ncbi:MAG: imidazolonepropionase [Anaerolineae bacterium]|nr:imidazolonepropionase [Anaerolineae bacterium]
MPENADLIVHHARQVVTCAGGGAKRGAALMNVGLVEDGAIVIQNGRIAAVGRSNEILGSYSSAQQIDATDKVVCPGFVDAHTHAVYSGDRVNEFELRIGGAAYMDILAAGGGILSTMRATRQASEEQLVREAQARLQTMLRLGTTTFEIKTGYGLDTETELKLLRVIEILAARFEIVPTFLGAHAIPPEYAGHTDEYVDLVIDEMLPKARQWYKQSLFAQQGKAFYIDVFCEDGVFDREQSRRVLEAGLALGLGAKLHADEFKALGGVTLAVELGAVSVDHLDMTPPHEIQGLAESETIGVVLPAVNFHLGSTPYANARGMIDAGAAVALATDLNPGSAPCFSMPLVMALACRYQKLLPAEALNACTLNAAYALGMGERVGSIEMGKQADLLILNAPDYRHLMYQMGHNLVETVIKRGVVQDFREALTGEA